MGGDWGPLNARSRGLSASLLPPDVLREAAGSDSAGELAGRLSRAGYPPDGGELPSTPDGLDRAVSRVTGWRLGLLHRWAGDLRDRLPVVFEAEDRRSLRALLRGIAEGADPERRLRGLVPTPTLSRRALREIADAGSVELLVERLREEEHPLADALADAPTEGPASSGLFEAELALDRAFARRASTAASPDPDLREFAARRVDRANAWTLLQAGRTEGERPAEELHLPGGTALPPGRFAEILAVEEADERRGLVASALGGREGALLSDSPAPAERVADRLLAADLRDARDRARRSPLGPWPFLRLVLRSRAEARDLRRLVWGVALGAPSSTLTPVSLP